MRVTVAEDCPNYRRGLVENLTDLGVDVVAETASGEDIVRIAEVLKPDIAILDIAIPPTRDAGLVAAEQLRHRLPGIGILVLSQHDETPYAIRLLDPDPSGKGFLLKESVVRLGPRWIHEALYRIGAGESVIDPKIIQRLTNAKRDHPTRNVFGRLSAQQLKVLRLLCEGYKNKTIADRLGIAKNTVDNHVNNIFERLDLDASASYDRRVLLVLKYLRDIPQFIPNRGSRI